MTQKEMRDKLSELIEKSINPCEHAIGLRTGKLYVTSLEMAEYLINNGVVVRDKGEWMPLPEPPEVEEENSENNNFYLKRFCRTE